jgi:hypothetical protein
MAKDSRIGESLWFIWDGDSKEPFHEDSIVFYTEEHVDIEEDVVRKALASSIQREGISDSLSGGFMLIASGASGHSYAGYSLDYETQAICNSNGYSESGLILSEVVPITWVEIFDVY